MGRCGFMQFQENLRAYREKAGYTAKEFAALLGLKYSTYAAYENQGREPKYETLCKIAAALHITTDELLGHELDKYEKTFNRLKSLGFTIEPNEKEGSPIRITYGSGGVRDFWVYSSTEAVYAAVQQVQNDIEQSGKDSAVNILRAKFYSDLSRRYNEVLPTVKDKSHTDIMKKLNQPPAHPGIMRGGPVFVFDNAERSTNHE